MASMVHLAPGVGLPAIGLSSHAGVKQPHQATAMVTEHDYVKRNQSTRNSTAHSEQPMYTCKLNSSFTASTQFVSSLTTKNLDDVEQVLADYPKISKDNVAVEKQESPSKPHVVTQVVVIHPDDDEDVVVENAIRNITESLNRSAAEKIAKGESPPSETVIEIVRVKQPASGYFCREDMIKEKQVFIHSPSKGGTLEESPRLSAQVTQEKISPRAATPSPPRYSATVRRKPDLSATCYFDTQQSSERKRSVSYTVTKTLPQNVVKATPQLLPRRNPMGQFQTAEPPKSTPFNRQAAFNKMKDSILPETEQLIAEDVDDDDLSVYSDRLNSSESSGYGSGLGFREDANVNRRPAYSYMHLIQMAICSKADRKMTLREIYQWIEDQFPYYRHQINKGWKNSIRHNLSLYDIFVREKNKSPNHTGSSYWTVRTSAKQKHGLRSLNRFYDSAGTQMNLLPKPPAAATAYALIPIQSGLPVMSSKPYIVQPLADSGSGSGISEVHEKRPRILKRAIRSISPGYQKQPRILSKSDANANRHLESGNISTRSSYPPTARSSQASHNNGRLLSLSLNTDCFESVCNDSLDNTSPQLDTSDIRQRLSLMNVRSTSIDLIEDETHSLSCIEVSTENVAENSTSSEVQDVSNNSASSGLPKPKMYRSRKSKLQPRNCDLEEEQLLSPAITPKKKDAICQRSRAESSLENDCDLPEILSALGHDLATPIKMMLNTPPKNGGDSFLSSTPISTVGDLPSPLSISLLGGLTPLSASKFSPRSCELNIDSGIFGSGVGYSPFKLCEQSPPYTRMRERLLSEEFIDSSPQMKRITPMRCLSSPKALLSTGLINVSSPGIGSLRRLGLQGLTPRRSDVNSDSGISPNDKSMTTEHRTFAKLFDGIVMDNEDATDDYFDVSAIGTWPGSNRK